MASSSDRTNNGLFEPLQPSQYKVTPTNHSAYVLLPALIMFTITALVVFVKTYTAWTMFRKLRMDDYAVIAALGFYLARTVTICLSVRYGLGLAAERLTQTQVRQLSQLYLASDVLLYPLLACAKCAVAMLVILIQTQLLWMLWGICGIGVAWAIAAVCVAPSQCGPTPWAMGPTDNDACIDQYAAQISIKVVDMLTDIALAALPGVLFMRLQMSRSNRLVIAVLFGLRIITPVFTALSLVAQRDFYDAPTIDRPFKAAEVAIWTSMGAGASLTTACLPSIRRFLADWAAGVSNAVMGDGDIALSALSNSKSSYGRKLSQPVSRTWVQGGRQELRSKDDDGESSKRLTGQITQTTDFMVHSEQLDVDKSGRSRSHSRGSSEISLVAPAGSTGRSLHGNPPNHSSRYRPT